MVTSSSDMNEFMPSRQCQEVILGSGFGGVGKPQKPESLSMNSNDFCVEPVAAGDVTAH